MAFSRGFGGLFMVLCMDILLVCKQMRINPFTVMVIREGEEIIRTLPLLESKGIAVDHGCIVTNALLYLKNQLEGK